LLPELILISAGVILLIIGVVLVLQWNRSFDNTLLHDNIMLENIFLNGSKSIKTTDLAISDPNRSLLLAIKSSSLKEPLTVKVKSLSGTVVKKYSFMGELVEQPKMKSKGKYNALVSNLGSEAVKISLLFGYPYGDSLYDKNKVNIIGLQESTLGAYLIIAGVVSLMSALGVRLYYLVVRGR
jgi:hypothetical protein